MMARLSPAERYSINREAMQISAADGIPMIDALRQVRADRLLNRLRTHEAERRLRREAAAGLQDIYTTKPYWMED